MVSETTPLTAGPNHSNGGRGSSFPTRQSPSWKNLLLVTALAVILIVGAFFAGSAFAGSGSSHAESTSTSSKHQQQLQYDVSDGDDDSSSASIPRYVATQFISFTINTIGGIADKGECEGVPVDPSNGFCYLGNANITEDLYHRLSIVEEVLNRIKHDAYSEYPDIDHADDVLKIVMLPEFFWRGPYGAYSASRMVKEGSSVIATSDRLRDLLADDFFNDFLFVFGTVIIAGESGKDSTTDGGDSKEEEREPWEIDTTEEIEYYNFAIVMKGGFERHHRYLVTKKYISNADFLSRTSLPDPTESDVNAYSKVEGQLAKLFDDRQTNLVKDNILEIDGLTIGLEICLDHRMGTLWNHIKSHRLPLVDILLVTSAGMAIERGPSPIVPGGVVYLSDGEASSAACMRTDNHIFHPETVCRADVGGLKHIPVGGPGYSSFIPLASCWDMERTEFLQGYYSNYQPQGCANTLKTYDIDVMDEFAHYPPSIEIYPTISLPDAGAA